MAQRLLWQLGMTRDLHGQAVHDERIPDATAQRAILIVDDERGPRESLRMILSGEHRVVTAPDGASALGLLRTEPFDLVTVDLNMPGMKGDELMRTIRAELPQVELIIITGCGSIETAVEGIRHGVVDYLTKPFDVVQVLASVERALARRPSRERMRGALEGPIPGSEASPARVRPPHAIEFLEVLAETIESRDLFMRGHARRVAFYADLIADRLLLSREERDSVRLAAFLHDIGKVGAPSDVLAGKVMPEPERLEGIQAHPAIGERLLLPLGLTGPIPTLVRHHHERFDGAGYPDGLAGEDTPLGSRIIAIADAFDAMTCARPYRRPRSREDALVELAREAPAQFDPNLVQVFHQLAREGAADSLDEAVRHAGAPPSQPGLELLTADHRGAA